MKARTAITIALIGATTVGMGGTVRNVVREATDSDASEAAAGNAMELSRLAARDETAQTDEIGRLREMLAGLERQIFTDDPDVARVGAELSESARRSGLTVSRLDSDPTRGVVTMTATGLEAATFGWLQAVERAMHRDGGLIEQLVVTAGPTDQMTVAIEMRYMRRDESMPNPGGPSRTRLLEATESWPASSVHAVAAAFATRPTDLPTGNPQPADVIAADGETALNPRPLRAASAVGRVELIGVASVNGATHYALRFTEERSIRALEVGHQAFGWKLVEAAEPGLVLQKEGQHYEIPR